MKQFIFAIIALGISSSAVAAVETAQVRVYTGKPNPQLAPFGSYVEIETGEVLNVVRLISTIAPNQLDTSCIYKISYTKNEAGGFTTVPPQETVSCGHDFPLDR
jgi:hypothetical protein